MFAEQIAAIEQEEDDDDEPMHDMQQAHNKPGEGEGPPLENPRPQLFGAGPPMPNPGAGLLPTPVINTLPAPPTQAQVRISLLLNAI